MKEKHNSQRVTRRKCTDQKKKEEAIVIQQKSKSKATRLGNGSPKNVCHSDISKKCNDVQRKMKSKASKVSNGSSKKNFQTDIIEKTDDIKKSKSAKTRLSNESNLKVHIANISPESNDKQKKSKPAANKLSNESFLAVHLTDISPKSNDKPKKSKPTTRLSNESSLRVHLTNISLKSNDKQKKSKPAATRSSNPSATKGFQSNIPEKSNAIQNKSKHTTRLSNESSRKVFRTDIIQTSNDIQTKSTSKANNRLCSESPKQGSETDILQKSQDIQQKSTSQAARTAKKVRHANIPQVSSKPTPPIVTRLRNCAKKNYIESSPDNSVSTTPVKEDTGNEIKRKIPIYKQTVVETAKKKGDLYEFDEFELDDVQTKKKKINDSSMYDKTMHEVLEKLEKKETQKRTRKKKIEKKNCVIPPKQKYKQKIDNVLQNVMVKVRARNSLDKSQNESENVREKVTNNNNESFSYNKEQESKNTAAVQHSLPRINILSNIEVLPAAINSSSQWHPDSIHSTIADVKNCFGFEDEEDISPPPPMATPRKDNMRMFAANPLNLSSINSPAFSPQKFNANSTLIHPPAVARPSGTPCRPQIVQRHPYFIQLKNNSLPSLKQDPVLDFSMVEGLEERCKKHTTTTLDVTRNSIQTSMLDFVNSPSKVGADQNRPPQLVYSLFDAEPIIRKPLIDINKNNQSVTKNATEVSRILLNDTEYPEPNSFFVEDNKENYHGKKVVKNKKRKRTARSASSEDEEQPFFGFDTSSIENSENVLPPRPTLAKPFRINLESKQPAMYKKKTVAWKNDDDTVDPVVPALPVISNESNITHNEANEPVEENEEVPNEDIHIFDDVEREFDDVDMTINIPKIKYEKKRRNKELDSTASDCEIEKPKKKKKDAMTKDEQAQFDKWVKDFNEMCAEVDKHVLIIE